MKTLLPTRSLALSLALAALIFTSCKQENRTADNTRHAVDPSFVNDVPFQDFDIDVMNDDTIQLAEGTSIYIPKGTFVDANGKTVVGKVQLHYRAFYTPGEIMASGITMEYDTANTKNIFSSAGMFEINGTQNGQPVSIAPGKSISMDFASSRDDDQFNFYSLDTANSKWEFISTTKAEPNKIREKLLAALQNVLPPPAEPHKYDPAKPIINLDLDVSDHPELAGYSAIMWQYTGEGTDPEKNKWIYGQEWSKAKLTLLDTATCKYNLNLSDGTRSFSTNIVPSLSGENYNVALNKYKNDLQSFEASERTRQERRKNIALTQRFQRAITITRMGIHNCDLWWVIRSRARRIHTRFHFNNSEFSDHPENVAVFVSTFDGRFVSSYNAAEEPELFYIHDSKTCIIAVIRGTGKVAVLNGEEFINSIPKNESNTIDIVLHTVSQVVLDSKDLDALINTL